MSLPEALSPVTVGVTTPDVGEPGPASSGATLAAPCWRCIRRPDGYGADLQLVQTVAALVEEGWRVVVVLPHPGPLVDRLAAVGAEPTFVDYPVLRKASANPVALARLLLAALACLPRAIRLVRGARPAALLVNTVTLPWWLLAGRLTRTPTIGYVHEAETSAGRLVRRGLLAPLLLADAVIVISEAVRAATIAAQPRLATGPG